MPGGANGVDQLRLDVVHAGQTVSAGRVLLLRHLRYTSVVSYDWIHFFNRRSTQMDADRIQFFFS